MRKLLILLFGLVIVYFLYTISINSNEERSARQAEKDKWEAGRDLRNINDYIEKSKKLDEAYRNNR